MGGLPTWKQLVGKLESHMRLSFGKRWWVDKPLPGLEAMIALITL